MHYDYRQNSLVKAVVRVQCYFHAGVSACALLAHMFLICSVLLCVLSLGAGVNSRSMFRSLYDKRINPDTGNELEEVVNLIVNLSYQLFICSSSTLSLCLRRFTVHTFTALLLDQASSAFTFDAHDRAHYLCVGVIACAMLGDAILIASHCKCVQQYRAYYQKLQPFRLKAKS